MIYQITTATVLEQIHALLNDLTQYPGILRQGVTIHEAPLAGVPVRMSLQWYPEGLIFELQVMVLTADKSIFEKVSQFKLELTVKYGEQESTFTVEPTPSKNKDLLSEISWKREVAATAQIARAVLVPPTKG